jgi:transcription termination factor Rho
MAERVEGVLELLPNGAGFLRQLSNNYLAGEKDPYVPKNLIQQFNLREGNLIQGPIIPPRDRTRGPMLQAIELVEGMEARKMREVIHFKDLIAIDPIEKFNIAPGNADISLRIVDLVAPIGKGQRALIVAPPRSGKTVLLQKLANAISAAHPEVHLMVLLIDERPEEVTDMRRTIRGEVIASSLDKLASGHVRVSEIVLERARRLVEVGKHVVIFLDSLTRLSRAYNREVKHSGRTMSGGLDARTMEKPREFFGSARNCENSGSLTIIATCLVDTGSAMDQVIFEEFKGTGNMELVLYRPLAERRIFPAIDINASGTRKEEKLRPADELKKTWLLRRGLQGHKPIEAMEKLISIVQKTRSNAEFLAALNLARD